VTVSRSSSYFLPRYLRRFLLCFIVLTCCIAVYVLFYTQERLKSVIKEEANASRVYVNKGSGALDAGVVGEEERRYLVAFFVDKRVISGLECVVLVQRDSKGRPLFYTLDDYAVLYRDFGDADGQWCYLTGGVVGE